MRTIVFIILFLIFYSENYSQNTIVSQQEKVVQYDTDSSVVPLEFSKEKIDDYKNDKAFDYTEKLEEENWWTQFKKWVSNQWFNFWKWLFGDYEADGILAFIIKSIPYLIIIGIVAFVIWLFIKLNPGARLLRSKEKPEVFFTEEEEIIRGKNIRKLINKALENKDYRLAVRYYYLLILKKLTFAHIIEYEFDKTNSDYIAEISSEEINANFKKATLLYDYIWYGNFAVSETEFNKARIVFTNLEYQIPESIE
jgi:hypothetical protein